MNYIGIGGVASVLAAALCLCASILQTRGVLDVKFNSGSEIFEPVRSALIRASRLNAAAAVVSSIAAICSGFALLQ